MQLNVLGNNDRAIAFYERFGVGHELIEAVENYGKSKGCAWGQRFLWVYNFFVDESVRSQGCAVDDRGVAVGFITFGYTKNEGFNQISKLEEVWGEGTLCAGLHNKLYDDQKIKLADLNGRIVFVTKPNSPYGKKYYADLLCGGGSNGVDEAIVG
ncbi:hypothetical protein SPFM20_00189 [Salmonella phage SPFM20]|nr:hypothetical protein SPFM20_00189 [Salmonella phage SPFM20]